MINVEGELLDGFHVEHVPEFNSDDGYDENALNWLAGMRAVWLLYHRKQWDFLAELGVRQGAVESRMSHLLYGERLTSSQAYSLARRVPEIELASVKLRMKYALKYRLKERQYGKTV